MFINKMFSLFLKGHKAYGPSTAGLEENEIVCRSGLQAYESTLQP
jgi:hypothetical protein